MDILKEIAKLSKQGLDIEFVRTDNDAEGFMLKVTVSWKIPDKDRFVGKGVGVMQDVYDSYGESAHEWLLGYLVEMAQSVEDYKRDKLVKTDDKREDS